MVGLRPLVARVSLLGDRGSLGNRMIRGETGKLGGWGDRESFGNFSVRPFRMNDSR